MKASLHLLLFSLLLFANPASQAQKAQPPVLKFGDPMPANAFVELAKAINPSVVNISTSTTARPQRGRDPMLDLLEEFYGLRMQPMQRRPQQALGTGFIIREDGLIVTNNHVIAGADIINVQLTDKDKVYEAKLVGSDDRTDIALIKISGGKFPFVQLGSSKDTEVGEWVAAFGNPFGNTHTMTKGIISAKGRNIGEINKFPLLQTDAPIYPGNSGGPLVNLKGLVIGVNSAIDARAMGGIGFAIPIDDVKNIIPVLEKSGRIRKGYLGVVLGVIDPQQAAALGMKSLEGAVIADVERAGPAAKAGIKPYDIITEFNGKKITNNQELVDAVQDSSIGSNAKLKLQRDGKQVNLSVKISELPDQRRTLGQNRPKFSGQKVPFELGFSVMNPDKRAQETFRLNQRDPRPVIVAVEPGSPAAQVGFAVGDEVLDVNRTPVSTVAELVKNVKKGTNTFRVRRQGLVLFTKIETP